MNRKYVIVSGLVEPMIQESMPDTEIKLFKSLTDLHDFIMQTPIRADMLYITQDVLMPALGNSIDWLISITSHAFFTADRVVYILSDKDDADKAIEHVKATKKIDNWSYVRGELTRVFVTNVVSGSNVSDDINPRKKAVIRQRRSEYVQSSLSKQQDIGNDYLDELSDIDVGEQSSYEHEVQTLDEPCKTYHITGLKTVERTGFAWMLAQYLSMSGRTVIIEKDLDYLTLGDMVTKSTEDVTVVYISELYTDLKSALRKIKMSKHNLIALLHDKKGGCDYNFIFNLIQVNLKDYVTSLVLESELSEVTGANKYVTVMPASVPMMLRTFDKLQYQHIKTFKYVAVDMLSVDGISIADGVQIARLVETMTGVEYLDKVPILKFKSMKLGGEFNAIHLFS